MLPEGTGGQWQAQPKRGKAREEGKLGLGISHCFQQPGPEPREQPRPGSAGNSNVCVVTGGAGETARERPRTEGAPPRAQAQRGAGNERRELTGPANRWTVLCAGIGRIGKIRFRCRHQIGLNYETRTN